MGPLQKALDEIKMSIPREILDVVFVKRETYYRQLPESIDDAITSKVLRARVLVDCNLVGGTEILIPLTKIIPLQTEYGDLIFRIPKELTQNRSINSVLSISYGDSYKFANKGSIGVTRSSGTTGIASQIINAASSIPVVSSDRVQLIGENTVLFSSPEFRNSDLVLRAVLANDENMAHLQMRSYIVFSDLCVLAVKAYIFNTMAVQMDIGQLIGGQNVGRFKDIVDSYSDANELYRTFLKEKWQKVALMNDRESWSRFKRLAIGGNR